MKQSNMQQLKKEFLKLEPHANVVVEMRKDMLAHITDSVKDNDIASTSITPSFSLFTIFMPRWFIQGSRIMAVFVLALGITFGGFNLSANASSKCLPHNNICWGVKKATESIEQAVALSPQAKVEIQKKIVNRRAYEMKQVLQTKDSNYVQHIQKINKQFEKNVKNLNSTLQEISTDDALSLALDLSNTVSEATITLKEAAKVLDSEQGEESKAVAKQVIQSAKEAGQSGLEVIAHAVNKKTDSGQTITAEEEEQIRAALLQKVDGMTNGVSEESTQNVLNSLDSVAQTPTSSDTAPSEQDNVNGSANVETPSQNLLEPNIQNNEGTLGQTVSTTPGSSIDTINNTENNFEQNESEIQGQSSTQNSAVTFDTATIEAKILEDRKVVEQKSVVFDEATQEIQMVKGEIQELITANKILEALDKAQDLHQVSALAQEEMMEINKKIGEIKGNQMLIQSITSPTLNINNIEQKMDSNLIIPSIR